MKKTVTTLLAGILAVSVTACGAGGDGKTNAGSPSAGPTGSPAASAAPEAPKPVKLAIGLPGGFEITSEDVIKGFQAKYPHITVEIQEAPWAEFGQKITAQVASGAAPDVWFQESAVILGYGSRGASEDLAPYIERDLNVDEYSKALFATQTPEGQVWGIPQGVNGAALAYNKKVFQEAGIAPPSSDWTYQTLIDIAKQLTKDTNGDGKPDVYGYHTATNITKGWLPWAKVYGGGILDETKTKAMLTDPKTIQGLTAWVDNLKTGITPTIEEQDAQGGSTQMIGEGKFAMWVMTYSEANTFNTKYPDLDYDTVLFPKGFDGNIVTPYVPNSWTIFSKSKQEVKDAAWEFIKYYLSDEAQDIVATAGASLPIKTSALGKLDTTKKPVSKQAFVEGIEVGGITLDENPTWNEWRNAAQPIFMEMINATKSVEDGAAEIQKKVQEILDRK